MMKNKLLALTLFLTTPAFAGGSFHQYCSTHYDNMDTIQRMYVKKMPLGMTIELAMQFDSKADRVVYSNAVLDLYNHGLYSRQYAKWIGVCRRW